MWNIFKKERDNREQISGFQRQGLSVRGWSWVGWDRYLGENGEGHQKLQTSSKINKS